MLNHTYTSVKNANLVDCGKKQHIPSQPSPLLKNNFLGEFRTELDKKKVLANLGIATSLSLEWEYIKGDIGRSEALIQELDSRTKYVSEIDGFQKSIIDGIKHLETFIGGEEEGEEEQNNRLTELETLTQKTVADLDNLKDYITNTVDVNVNKLQEDLATITESVKNITNLIQVSSKEGNAIQLLGDGDVAEGETPGLYVTDLSPKVNETSEKVEALETEVADIKESLDDFVTKEDLGGDGFEFVDQGDFDSFVASATDQLDDIREELANTVKTGEDGHVDTLYVNKISKNNDDANIVITDSFEVDSAIPLDVRFVRETLADLYALPVKVCYPGMGVIVNSLSSLYVLRKPAEGVVFNQDYIKNPNNWKCPEDLVTVALTKDEYENLEEINPSVFYYVYEEEITLTQEPKREEYLTDAEFQKAWEDWTNSLKTLSQEYMSASWGVDIENKLSKKASSQSVSLLMAEIKSIKGDGISPSLESLNQSVEELQLEDSKLKERVNEVLISYEGVEQGRLVDAERNINEVKDSLHNYVTKEYIQDAENDFIFVKEDDYNSDKKEFQQQLSEQVSTKEVVTDAVSLSGKKLEGTEKRLQYNAVEIANLDDIPEIQILTQEEYDNLPESDIKDDVYYYTFDGDNIYVTKNELDRTSARLQQQINTLFKGGTAEDIESTLEVIFLPIETWNAFQQEYVQMSNLVMDLNNRLSKLEPLKFVNGIDDIQISGDPGRCYISEDTIYIQSDLITVI